MKSKGFTLIELLIVVALIGILAVALLSAINPVEQAKKARDAGRKSDSAELLNAYERYYSTYGCYPWARATGACGADALAGGAAFHPDFAAGGDSVDLVTIGEMKEQFANRDVITNTNADKTLFVSESDKGIMSVCFEPESTNARSGGLGKIQNNTNTSVAAVTCGAGPYPDTTCYVCVPQ